MADRIEKKELADHLADRMKTDKETAEAWIDGLIERGHDI